MARMGLIQLSINDRWSDCHLACQQLALVKFNGLTIQTENIIETEPAIPSLHSSINLLLEHWHPQVNHLDEFLQAWCQYLHRSPWWQRSQESTNFSCSSSDFIASLLWRPIVVLSIQLCPIFAFANFKNVDSSRKSTCQNESIIILDRSRRSKVGFKPCHASDFGDNSSTTFKQTRWFSRVSSMESHHLIIHVNEWATYE